MSGPADWSPPGGLGTGGSDLQVGILYLVGWSAIQLLDRVGIGRENARPASASLTSRSGIVYALREVGWMYASHFGLRELPFAITPDPRYLYMSGRHREALAHLLYGIGERGGFVQLTGEVGTGKTTVCRCLLEQLPPGVDVALILNPRLTSLELMATVCDELRIAYPPGTASLKVLVDALYAYLLEAHARDRRTVLIIDEAQDLTSEVLEQIRLLTNLETPTEKLLQIILIGQPELISFLNRQRLRQLAQRITARYHLLPLSKEETRAYIRHRLEVAGRDGSLFTEPAMRHVHRLSDGVPRLINVICDRALLGAYARDRTSVDAATVRTAAAEVFGERPRPLARRALAWFGAAAAVLAVACAGVLLFAGPPRLAQLAGDRRPAPPDRQASAPLVAVAGVSAAPSLPSLEELLADASSAADQRAAVAALYRRWDPTPREAPPEPSCREGLVGHLACVSGTGSWRRLRRLNLPVVIELVGATAEPRYGLLTALGPDRATLELAERSLTAPLVEIDRFWQGAYLLLWKSPAAGALPLVPGRRGKSVEWLRERLDEVDGQRAGGERRDLYDDELRARVVSFQRSRALTPDGLVGLDTLTQLSAAARDAGIPWLSSPVP